MRAENVQCDKRAIRIAGINSEVPLEQRSSISRSENHSNFIDSWEIVSFRSMFLSLEKAILM